MAQNEGRTLRRAPKLSLNHVVLFLLMLALALAFGMAVHSLKAAAESTLTADTTNRSLASTNQGTVATAEPTVQPASAREIGTPNCAPAKYRLPTPINMQDLPQGLTIIEDSTQQYIVYGNTPAERLLQLQRCAPIGEFAGAASYQVTWQYSYSFLSNGLCRVAQPKIGLHLTMILPKWSAGTGATVTDRAVWNAYIHSLTIHEQGHYALSRQYAQAMADGLLRMPEQSCDSMKSTADRLINGQLAQLKTAQENYDTFTDHGATQGATL
jgi:predicted secreted Zn-dependent protease